MVFTERRKEEGEGETKIQSREGPVLRRGFCPCLHRTSDISLATSAAAGFAALNKCKPGSPVLTWVAVGRWRVREVGTEVFDSRKVTMRGTRG